jgi:hypothetical protein
MRYFILFLVGVFCLSSCFLSTWDARLVLVNGINQRIRYFEEVKNTHDFIPDTTFCDEGDIYWISPHSEQTIRSQNKWEYLLKDHPDKVLRIYIINEDSLTKYGMCRVFKQQIFMKRFDLTYDSLEKLQWRVVYDNPTP